MPTDAKFRLQALVAALDDDTAARILPELWALLASLLLPQPRTPKARPEVRQ
jgi:hypothetical protein